MNRQLVERFKVEGLALQTDTAKFLLAYLRTQRNQARALDDIIANIPKQACKIFINFCCLPANFLTPVTSNILGVEPLRKAIESISQVQTTPAL